MANKFKSILSDENNHITHGNLRIVGNNESADQGTAWIRSNGDYIVINPVDGEHVYLNWDTGQSGGSGHVYVPNNVYAAAFYDRGDTNYYVDPASTSNLNALTVGGTLTFNGGNVEGYVSYTIDMSNTSTYAENTYYPVTIGISQAHIYNFRIENALNSNVPGWSTHSSGFSLLLDYTTHGNGWGTQYTNRNIRIWSERWANVTILGGITQMNNSSYEVLWLRGGGKYYLKANKAGLTVTPRSSTFTANSQSVSPTTSIVNDVYESAEGGSFAVNTLRLKDYIYHANDADTYFGFNGADQWKLHLGGGDRLIANTSTFTSNLSFYAPVFYDSNNTSYYFDGAGTTYVNQLTATRMGVNPGGSSSTRHGISLYDGYASGEPTYGLLFTGTSGFGTHGSVTSDWATYFTMNNSDTRGWIFRKAGASNTSSISAGGIATFDSSVRSPIFYDSNDTNYYVDPASTSIVNDLYVNGKFSFRDSASIDDDRGIYFDGNTFSGAYAIFRESGSWTSPYPDLRIAFHTGIKLGANAGYNGIRFYTDYDMATQVMSVNNGSDGMGTGCVYVNSSLQAGDSLRAPIFYDSNDTNYYLNPAGGAVIQTLIIDDYIYHKGDTNTHLYFEPDSIKLTAGDGKSRITVLPTEIEAGQAVGSNNQNYSTKLRLQGKNNYSDGTTWYGNYGQLLFNASTNMTSSSRRYLFTNAYNNNEFAIVQSAAADADPAVNDSGSGLNAGALVMTWNNSRDVTIHANARSPIFYDSNDTGYYLDANNSGTALSIAGLITNNTGQTRVKYSVWSGSTYGIGMKNGFDYGHIGANEYAMTFQFNNNDGRGFWWGDDGHTDDQGAMSLTTNGKLVVATSISVGEGESVTSPNTGTLYVSGTGTASTDFRAPIFYDSADTSYYIDPASNGSKIKNLVIVPQSESWSEGIRFDMPTQGAWGGLRWARNGTTADSGNWALGFTNESNDDITFYSGTGNHRLRLDHSGNVTAQGSSRAPIFYDSANTAKYIDPAGNSNITSLDLSGNLNMNNANITNVNHITINDPGYQEGISWNSGNGWYIYEAPDNNSNAAGNLQISTSSTRRLTIDTSGNVEAPTSTAVISAGNHVALNCAQWASSGSSTGAIKITLPGSTSNYSMPVIRITTYEYDSRGHVIYTVSGHNWSTATNWYNTRVTSEGGPPYTVRLGHDGSTHCIIIGETNTSWEYGHVTVELLAHPQFYTSNQDMTVGWGISQITSLPSTVTSQTVGQLWHSANDGTGSALDADLLDGQQGSSYLRSDVSATNSVDLRAPIFYDSNDTNYYVDPASTGTSLNLAGDIVLPSDTFVKFGASTNIEGATSGTKMILTTSTDFLFRFSGTTQASFDNNGIAIFNGSARSPIFYDSNDTNYYIDPTGNTSVNVQGTIISPSKGHVLGTSSATVQTPVLELKMLSGAENLRLTDGNTLGTSWGPFISFVDGGGTRRGYVQGIGTSTTAMDMRVVSEYGTFSVWTGDSNNEAKRFEISTVGKCAINTTLSNRDLIIGGSLQVGGTLYKNAGSFAIDHPLESKKQTHKLIHSFIEGPQADNIYRGKATLVNGVAEINIDEEFNMTQGTFVALNTNVQCFTTNESNWDLVKGTINNNVLTIESQNTNSTATISWLVIGERQDDEIKASELTDDNGKIIVEPTIEQFEQ